jgi:hypothetical protein
MDPSSPIIKRFWIRITYWDDGTTVDNPARSAEEAMQDAKAASSDLKADVDAMDGAAILATYRSGQEI